MEDTAACPDGVERERAAAAAEEEEALLPPPSAPITPATMGVEEGEKRSEAAAVVVAVEEEEAVAEALEEGTCPGFAFPPACSLVVVGEAVGAAVGVKGRERTGGAVAMLEEDPVPPLTCLEIEGERERDTVGSGEVLVEGEAVPLLDKGALAEGVGDPVAKGRLGVNASEDVV